MSGVILTGNEALDSSCKVEYIVPFPYSSNLEVGAGNVLEPRLSILSQMSIDMAIAVHEQHPDATIVIAGEACYGDEMLDTTDLMVARVLETSDVPLSALAPVRTSKGTAPNNTYLQSEAVAHYFAGKANPQNIVVGALQYHQPRVQHTVEAYGVASARFVTVEAVFEAAGITDYDDYLPHIRGLESSERVLRMINMLDGRGRLLNLAMRRSGPRLVDVVADETGELHLEQGLAKDKLAALTETGAVARTRTA